MKKLLKVLPKVRPKILSKNKISRSTNPAVASSFLVDGAGNYLVDGAGNKLGDPI